jgi:hypothetical protein
MASDATLKMVGDWSSQVAIPLSNALAATVEMTGRSGRQACDRAMVMMAQSARAMTKQAPKNRPVKTGPHGKYVERYSASGIKEDYQWRFDPNRTPRPRITWEQAKRIVNRKLAGRSWMWGVMGLRDSLGASNPIPGVAQLDEIIGETECGLILTNRLGYITKPGVMPGGWEQEVERRATDRIMAQIAGQIERQFGVEVPRLAAQRQKRAERRLSAEFRRRARA